MVKSLIMKKIWRKISIIFLIQNGVLETPPSFEPPHLIFVVKNVLYAYNYEK